MEVFFVDVRDDPIFYVTFSDDSRDFKRVSSDHWEVKMDDNWLILGDNKFIYEKLFQDYVKYKIQGS